MNIESAARSPLWWDVVAARQTRPSLETDIDVDVVVIGAGFTGLWTAYHLATLDPALRIAIIESQHVGFGASGRNGGWCHAEKTAVPEKQETKHGDGRARGEKDTKVKTGGIIFL